MRDRIRPILHLNLADDLAQRIQQLIRRRGFDVGDRLPTITAMAADFGVGAPTIREALKTLEAIGIVDIRHGSGVFVKRAHESLIISNPFYQTPASKKILLDLIETRMPIEILSAQLAAQHATAAHRQEMERLLERAAQHLGDDDEVLNQANMAFHRQIAIASGNSVVKQMLEVLTNLFTREQRMILDIQNERQKDHDEHRGILEAIQLRRPPLAARRMSAHLAHVQRVLSRWDPVRSPLNIAS